DVPSFTNSAMDGYAFSGEGVKANAPLTLIGKSLAGQPFTGRVNAGECVRIMTGAALPLGTDTVMMQEKCRVQDQQVHLEGDFILGQNVRYPAEDLAQDQRVFPAGTRVNARVLSVLSSLGLTELYVYRPLKVALLS